jgi:hypothetical protein
VDLLKFRVDQGVDAAVAGEHTESHLSGLTPALRGALL